MARISVRVGVGSESRVKLEATRRGFANYFSVDVAGVKVDSGVGAQPLGDETFTGAAARAARALRAGGFDFGVGIEGGIGVQHGVSMGFGVACVVNSAGYASFATSGWFPLPVEALELVGNGLELGDAMDKLAGVADSKNGPGAVGLLTGNVVDRTTLYEDAVVFALIPHINQKLGWRLEQLDLNRYT